MNKPSRRDFIYLGVGGGLLAAGFPVVNLVSGLTQTKTGSGSLVFPSTPSNSLGPFYRRGAPRTEKLVPAGERGTPLVVTGNITDTTGRPLMNAVIEVFHADDSGEYDMSGFRCRGEIPVASNGAYRFETVMPGGYGGRAQHIHYRISVPGQSGLITQLYFETDPKFGGNVDKNYTRDRLVEHRELIRPVTVLEKGGVAHRAVTFDLRLPQA